MSKPKKRKPKQIVTATPVAIFGAGRVAQFDRNGNLVAECDGVYVPSDEDGKPL